MRCDLLTLVLRLTSRLKCSFAFFSRFPLIKMNFPTKISRLTDSSTHKLSFLHSYRKSWSQNGDKGVKRLFTPEIKRLLKDWLVRRRENPYPSREEKKTLALETGKDWLNEVLLGVSMKVVLHFLKEFKVTFLLKNSKLQNEA